ncbi:MAG: nicotinate-nucleotide--dimethylbenzimidazole phosphoribosyltransferase [Veillonellaceae bacterium]|nr:nicotinate-nucleotide--dimethylbenzimidazole phosphoribosyltransferase [Veillonellaceae bacterium]
MEEINAVIRSIKPLDENVMRKTQRYLDSLTKPQGSLAVLEKMARQLAGVQGTERPSIPEKAVVLMAADHGVAEEGVSAVPAEVTEQMVYNFVRGGAGINVLARHAGASLILVDVGVKVDLMADLPIQNRKIRYGTGNMRREPAMTREEVVKALKVGIQTANALADQGVGVIGLGEMGIGNTTASSAIVHVFTGEPVNIVVGRGTGITDRFLQHKIKIIEEAVALHQPKQDDAVDVLSKVGGLEIAAMAGVVIGAAARRVLIMLDGFIASAAVLAAYRLSPAVKPYLMASHLSEEPGHAVILRELGLEPCLRLNMRLGEGTGAALGMTILDAAIKILNEMATFDEAGVAAGD